MSISNLQGPTRPSMSGINITPLVDVVLVLLVIFMVTAPILQTGVEVNLPQTRMVRAIDPEKRAVITISRDELLFYRSDPSILTNLAHGYDRRLATARSRFFCAQTKMYVGRP